MNLTLFRARIQSTVGLAAASSGHPEQALVDGWVNEGVVQFLVKTKAVKKTASLAFTPGVGDYVIDPEILSFEDLSVGSRQLEVVDTGQIRRWRLGAGSGSDEVGKYAYEGQTLMVYPTPTANTPQLKIVYVQRPSPLVNPTDDPGVSPFGQIPAEYHPVIEAYAKWKAGEYANNEPSQNGQMWKAEFEAGCVQARTTETRRAGVQIGRALPGWRRTAGVGVSPGIDSGV